MNIKGDWSYSRVGAFKTCPYMFKYIYIYGIRGDQNAFSEFGGFCHELLEKYNNSEVEPYELIYLYKDGYSENVKLKFPYNKFVNMEESYYNDGLSFFSEFSGFDTKTLCAEKEIRISLDIEDGHTVHVKGFIDRVYETKNGGIGIEDYKSKKKFSSIKERNKYFEQLYLYSAHFIQEEGVYPEELTLFLFRSNNKITIKFDVNEYNRVVSEFSKDILKIMSTEEFEKVPNNFFCLNLCSMSCIDCEYKNKDTWNK